jgi:phage tail tube protein FII
MKGIFWEGSNQVDQLSKPNLPKQISKQAGHKDYGMDDEITF